MYKIGEKVIAIIKPGNRYRAEVGIIQGKEVNVRHLTVTNQGVDTSYFVEVSFNIYNVEINGRITRLKEYELKPVSEAKAYQGE